MLLVDGHSELAATVDMRVAVQVGMFASQQQNLSSSSRPYVLSLVTPTAMFNLMKCVIPSASARSPMRSAGPGSVRE